MTTSECAELMLGGWCQLGGSMRNPWSGGCDSFCGGKGHFSFSPGGAAYHRRWGRELGKLLQLLVLSFSALKWRPKRWCGQERALGRLTEVPEDSQQQKWGPALASFGEERQNCLIWSWVCCGKDRAGSRAVQERCHLLWIKVRCVELPVPFLLFLSFSVVPGRNSSWLLLWWDAAGSILVGLPCRELTVRYLWIHVNFCGIVILLWGCSMSVCQTGNHYCNYLHFVVRMPLMLLLC